LKYPEQARLWSRAVIVAVPALASFILDDLSSDIDPMFRHWHSVWHVLALVSTAYAMAFVLAVQLAQVSLPHFAFFTEPETPFTLRAVVCVTLS
jgi:hypothetical protein